MGKVEVEKTALRGGEKKINFTDLYQDSRSVLYSVLILPDSARESWAAMGRPQLTATTCHGRAELVMEHSRAPLTGDAV